MLLPTRRTDWKRSQSRKPMERYRQSEALRCTLHCNLNLNQITFKCFSCLSIPVSPKTYLSWQTSKHLVLYNNGRCFVTQLVSSLISWVVAIQNDSFEMSLLALPLCLLNQNCQPGLSCASYLVSSANISYSLLGLNCQYNTGMYP